VKLSLGACASNQWYQWWRLRWEISAAYGDRMWKHGKSWEYHGLVGGDWNHGILSDFPETVGNGMEFHHPI